MDTLRSHLGAHTGLRLGQLHEREAGALVLRAGRAGGLVVRTEHRVAVVARGGTKTVFGEIDICWFCPSTNRLLVAWEIDGRNAGEAHILGDEGKGTAGNKAKFGGCGAALKVQVLCSVKNDLSEKPKSRQLQIERWLPGVAVVSDENLMEVPGIDEWLERAHSVLRFAPISREVGDPRAEEPG